jgi:hypothetical protein
VVERNTDLGHRILLSNIRILARKSRRIDQIMSEAKEIKLHPNNVNGVDDYYLSRSRKPVVCPLKGKRQHAVFKNKTVILTLLITHYVEDHPIYRPTWKSPKVDRKNSCSQAHHSHLSICTITMLPLKRTVHRHQTHIIHLHISATDP